MLCILTYIGKGYSASFTANYDAVIQRLKKTPSILVVAGPDDICQPMLANENAHCLQNSINSRDRLAAQSLNHLWAQNAQNAVKPGKIFVLNEVKIETMRQAFQKNQIRQACLGCEWFSLCTQVANENFHQAKLNFN